MPNIFRLGGGGAKKNYIFKDGIFKIQPTQSNFTNANGYLTGGNYLRIPYVKSGEMVYIKYQIIANDRVGLALEIDTIDLPLGNPGNVPEMTFPYFSKVGVNKTIILGNLSNQSISISGSQNCTTRLKILEIWTEKE